MWIRNEVWKRVRPEFSSAQVEAVLQAADEAAGHLGMYVRLDLVPVWVADKLRAAVARIEVGA